MPVRSLNGLDSSVRSLNGLSDRIDYTVSLPLTMNSDYNIKLSNLTSYGSANQILKMNGNGTALEFSNETDTVYTTQTPIVIINGVIGLNGIAGYGNSIGRRQLIRTNSTSTGLEYFDQPDFITGVQSPLAISNTGVISLSTLNSYGSAGQILKVNTAGNALEYANQQDTSAFITSSSSDTLTNKSMSYSQLTTPPISNDGLSNTKLIQFRNSGSPARCIEFSNSSGAYRHTVEHSNTGLQFYAGNSSTSINLTEIINISTTGLKIQRIEMIENTDSFNVLMFNSSNGLIAKSRSTYIMPSTSGTLALTSNIPDTSAFITSSSSDTLTNKSMSYSQLTTPPISNDGLSNTKLIQFRNSGSPARCIEFSNSSGAYRHTVEHSNTGLQFYAGNSSTSINLTEIINISTTGLKIQRIEMIENTDSFNVLMFNSSNGLIAKSRSTYIMPSTSGTLALTSNIPDTSAFITSSSSDTLTNKSIVLSAVGNAVSQIIKFNNDNFNTIGANLSTTVAGLGGLELKAYAVIENSITRTDTSDNMRTILSSNVFQVLKGSNPSVNKTLLFLRDGGSNSLGHVTNDLLLLGKDILIIVNNAIFLGGATALAMYITSTGGAFLGNNTPVSSDDRIKFNETKITYNALETINKLVVVEYDKRYNRDLPETQYGVPVERHLLNDTPQKEYGFIAQDTWNNIPELRFSIKNVDTTIPENFNEEGLLIEDCKVRTTNSEGEEFIDRKYLSVDYANINILNIRAVQELSEIVKQQQIIIDKLINSSTFANFRKNI